VFESTTHVQHPQEDTYVVVKRGNRLGVAVLLVGALALLGLPGLPRESAVLFGLMLTAAVILAPVFAIAAWRALRPVSRVIVRRKGQVLVDGDPVEFARVELRVLEPRFRRAARGYALSFWVMAPNGPEDILVGSYASLLSAAIHAEEWEVFLRKADLKQPGRFRKRAE
jgi:hypothetical protein